MELQSMEQRRTKIALVESSLVGSPELIADFESANSEGEQQIIEY